MNINVVHHVADCTGSWVKRGGVFMPAFWRCTRCSARYPDCDAVVQAVRRELSICSLLKDLTRSGALLIRAPQRTDIAFGNRLRGRVQ